MDLRQNVLEHVNNADDRLLKLIKALAESYEEERFNTVNEEHYKEVDRRREAYLKGEGESYTWEEVKEHARKLKK
ncbi:MAG TPA: addiction module protein [Flavobacteriaceae bacterium]|nr:addiction module protein [Flavobacteriaceae bacterium]